MSASIRLEGGDVLAAALGRMARAAADLSPLMGRIGASLVTSTRMRFEREQGPDGTRWPPSLRARVMGGVTLTDSARLRDSITHRPAARSVEIGTDVVYAAIHQFGGTIRPRQARALAFRLADGGFATVGAVRMPARPFLGLDEGDRTEIAAIATDYFADAVGPEARP